MNSFFPRGEEMSVGMDVRSMDGERLGYVLLWDERTDRQSVIVDRDRKIVGLTTDGIDPKSVENFRSIPCVRDRRAAYGFCINNFHDGIAVVSWCVQPDGRYWEDEGGFGGTSEEEITLYSLINRQGRFCVPFLLPKSGSFPEIERQLRELIE